MPCQRLVQAQASHLPHLPELDGPIPARADQEAAVRGKGQPAHPVGMSRQACKAGSRVCLL